MGPEPNAPGCSGPGLIIEAVESLLGETSPPLTDGVGGNPIERGEESGKPISEKARDIRAGRTLKGSVDCVDKAELEICIAYIYPPLQEHTEVDCDDFFD